MIRRDFTGLAGKAIAKRYHTRDFIGRGDMVDKEIH